MVETKPSLLAERIDRLCELGDINERELERLAGLARGQIWTIRHRNTAAALKTLTSITEATGASMDWLTSGKGDPPSKDVVQTALCARSDALIAQRDASAPHDAPTSAE